ncbi:MAG: type II secretion system GspH family protein [Candidatus Accumulibacter sp.]|jgi:prepilin-type N-terminal cleavage/methylation domain-containing protein|nr:type II secretion system GspH family protein [Accumulibacter sp.]
MSTAARPKPRPGGFTLIELLVVIGILSSVTLLAFNVSGDDRAQLRYDDTRQRLHAMERAILGRLGPSGEAAAGGFVADNGRLPTSVSELLSPGLLATRAAVEPIFDPKPDATSCANNGGSSPGDEITLGEAPALLVKGHRGNYLGGLAFNGRFRDGWGNENGAAAADALNFGWDWKDDVPEQLTITSFGADNVDDGTPGLPEFPGPGPNYATDAKAVIGPGDWRVPIGGWTVTVTSAVDLDFAADITLSASLLVYENEIVDTMGTQSARYFWRRYSSSAETVSCFDGDGDGYIDADGDGTIDLDDDGEPKTCATRSITLAFSPGCHPGDPDNSHESIPQGRHLLVLVRNGQASGAWDDGDTVYAPRVLAQIDAVAGMALPAARLEIR